MLISYIIAYPLSLPLMVCLFWFSRWRWIYLCAHGIDLLGPAGDNPHAVGTGMEKRAETLCHQFLLKSHLELFVIHPHYYYFIYFINDYYYFIYLFYWSLDEVVGDIRIHVRASVRASVCMSRGCSKTVHYFFLKICS